MSTHPATNPGRSAGVLLYRIGGSAAHRPGDIAANLEVYIVHPGGPYFRNKDVWGIAKGLIEDGEDEVTAARREFAEETGFPAPTQLEDLGTVTTHRGKVIHAFAGEWTNTESPPAVVSNTCPIEWPRGSGTWIEIPEVDDGRFFALEEARVKMHGCQGDLVDRLVELLKRGIGG